MARNLFNFNVKNNLFSFFVGSNDLWLGLVNVQITDEHLSNIVLSIIANTQKLISFGAKHFIVFGPANLGLMPYVTIGGKQNSLYFN